MLHKHPNVIWNNSCEPGAPEHLTCDSVWSCITRKLRENLLSSHLPSFPPSTTHLTDRSVGIPATFLWPSSGLTSSFLLLAVAQHIVEHKRPTWKPTKVLGQTTPQTQLPSFSKNREKADGSRSDYDPPLFCLSQPPETKASVAKMEDGLVLWDTEKPLV